MLTLGGGGGGGITNPYGRTKRICEEILGDLYVFLSLVVAWWGMRWDELMRGKRCQADPEWQTMSLRYTNPSGAHPSGWIGEDPTNAANLMPIVTQVLQGKREEVMVCPPPLP